MKGVNGRAGWSLRGHSLYCRRVRSDSPARREGRLGNSICAQYSPEIRNYIHKIFHRILCLFILS